MSQSITIIRIDPVGRKVAKMLMKCGQNAVSEVRRILRAGRDDKIGWHKLTDIEEVRLTRREPHPELQGLTREVDVGPTPLVAAGKLNTDEAVAKWHLRGCEEHAGIGILFGQGLGGGMVNVPVDVAWINARIVWTDGEDMDSLRERAEALAPGLPDEVIAALRGAVDGGPLAEGGSIYWLAADQAEIFPAMIRLGLGDEATNGQRLTRLGAATRELVAA